MEAIYQTTGCKLCNGHYLKSNACPVYGLKYQNGPCPPGDVIIYYKEVKVRNDVPWLKFWRSHYNTQRVVTNVKNN